MAIVIDKVTVAFEEKMILNDFSLELPKEGVVCFSGPSGCGKTTLLLLLAGIVKPQRGKVSGLGGKRVSVVFQEDRLLPWFSAKDNIEIAGSDAEELLNLLELNNTGSMLPHELSGGMRRRVAIARALSFGGDVLLLDEPFNGLDAPLSKKTTELIKTLYDGRLVVMITHNLELVKNYVDVVYYAAGPPFHIVNTEFKKAD